MTLGRRRLGMGLVFILGLGLQWVVILRDWSPLWFAVSALLFVSAYVLFGLHHSSE